jgi:hypothetical protein
MLNVCKFSFFLSNSAARVRQGALAPCLLLLITASHARHEQGNNRLKM